MEAKFEIADVDALKALAHEQRMKILELLGQPRTVKSLAERLGVPPTKLYYHVNLMEKHGLIVVVDERVVSGIVEKVYRVRAHRYELAADLLPVGPSAGSSPAYVSDMTEAIFNNARDEFVRTVRARAGRQKRQPDEPAPAATEVPEIAVFMKAVVALPPDRIKAAADALNEWMEMVDGYEAASECQPDRQQYGMLLTFYPLPAPAAADGHDD